MVLGEQEGKDLAKLQEQMVKDGDMPRSYVLSKERIERARKGLTVQQQDERGVHMIGVV
jgi:hypothetical protein